MIIKPGYKTTELLVSVLAGVGSWLAAWDGTLPAKYAAIASAASAGAYALARAITKYAALSKTTVHIAPVPAVAPAPVVPPV